MALVSYNVLQFDYYHNKTGYMFMFLKSDIESRTMDFLNVCIMNYFFHMFFSINSFDEHIAKDSFYLSIKY